MNTHKNVDKKSAKYEGEKTVGWVYNKYIKCWASCARTHERAGVAPAVDFVVK